MEVSAIEPIGTAPKRRANRLTLILALGVLAIVVSLLVRNSGWAREKRLENLNLEELSLAIHDNPNDSLTFFYYGSALLKANNFPDSARAFQRAMDLDKKNMRAQVGLASAQLRGGNLDNARTTFEQIIKATPNDSAAHLGLAQTYYQMGSPRRALPHLKRVTELEPKSAPAWYQLGKAYGDDRQSDLAIEALERATKLDPKSAVAWRDLGQLYRHYSKTKEAEASFKQALRNLDTDPVTWLWLGQLYSEMSNTAEYRGQAEQCFLATIARAPDIAEPYYELGRLYERSNNFQAAIPRYRKACELDPANHKALYNLGRCLAQTGEKAEGEKLMKASEELRAAQSEIDMLENRLRTEPKNRPMHLRLGRLYRRYGNFEGALSQYDLYQRLGPKDPAIDKEAVAYIKELQKQGQLPASK